MVEMYRMYVYVYIWMGFLNYLIFGNLWNLKYLSLSDYGLIVYYYLLKSFGILIFLDLIRSEYFF